LVRLSLLDGFRKVISNEAVNLKMDKDDMEFAHQFFVQGQERLLEFIKRKVMFHFNFTDVAFVKDFCRVAVFMQLYEFLIL